ncbi:MAG TPA: hypothetical protein VMW52_10185 [Phycisphaerae bacterium]|nr:hypothetical protein [Phycisphaerae bacterium]
MKSWSVDSKALYLCDNGACYCGRHLGATATFSGHDISGQAVERVTPAGVRACRDSGWEPRCEACGATASVLH